MSDQQNVVELHKAVDLSVVLSKEAEEKAKQLPAPQGYRILCAIPEAEEAFDSGLIKADETRRHDELLTTVLFVVDMGPDCYADKERFPNGPYCKKGDFIFTANFLHLFKKMIFIFKIFRTFCFHAAFFRFIY